MTRIEGARLSQAQRIVDKFGGHYSLARLIGVRPSTVYRWCYPRGKSSGTGGVVPPAAMAKLLRVARLEGVFLTAEDLDPRTYAEIRPNGDATRKHPTDAERAEHERDLRLKAIGDDYE